MNHIIKNCDKQKDNTADKEGTQSLERIIQNDHKQMYDALLKFTDNQTVSKKGSNDLLNYSEILEDLKYDERNTKALLRESIKKYNEGFVWIKHTYTETRYR